MNRKIPAEDAFRFYTSLGAGRSYAAVAEKYDASKQAITNLANRDGWQERLEKIESEVRERGDAKLVESLDQMNERHLRVLRAIQGKALETLKATPLSNAMDAVRALEMSLKQERLIRGEPSERTELSVEEVTKREMDRWLVLKERKGEAGSDGGESPDA